jgi:hypothetical protein
VSGVSNGTLTLANGESCGRFRQSWHAHCHRNRVHQHRFLRTVDGLSYNTGNERNRVPFCLCAP